MNKLKIIFVALLMLLIATGCQIADPGNAPAPASDEEPGIQGDLNAAPEPIENGEPVALPEQSTEQALRNAQVLTEHLMNRVFHEGIVESGESVTDRELFYFFTTLPGYMQNQDHPYWDAVTITSESLYIFPEEKVQKIACELFGVEGWAFNDGSIKYNADAGQYESGLEFGTGANQYHCSDPQATYLEDIGVIEVVFDLEHVAAVDGDPGWEHLGRYCMRYHVVQDSSLFLRYETTQKAQ